MVSIQKHFPNTIYEACEWAKVMKKHVRRKEYSVKNVPLVIVTIL